MRECAAGSDEISPLTVTLTDAANRAVSIRDPSPAAAGRRWPKADEGHAAETLLSVLFSIRREAQTSVSVPTAVQIRWRRAVSLSSASEASSQLLQETRRAPSPCSSPRGSPSPGASRHPLPPGEGAVNRLLDKKEPGQTKSCSCSRRVRFQRPLPAGRVREAGVRDSLRRTPKS